MRVCGGPRCQIPSTRGKRRPAPLTTAFHPKGKHWEKSLTISIIQHTCCPAANGEHLPAVRPQESYKGRENCSPWGRIVVTSPQYGKRHSSREPPAVCAAHRVSPLSVGHPGSGLSLNALIGIIPQSGEALCWTFTLPIWKKPPVTFTHNLLSVVCFWDLSLEQTATICWEQSGINSVMNVTI